MPAEPAECEGFAKLFVAVQAVNRTAGATRFNAVPKPRAQVQFWPAKGSQHLVDELLRVLVTFAADPQSSWRER